MYFNAKALRDITDKNSKSDELIEKIKPMCFEAAKKGDEFICIKKTLDVRNDGVFNMKMKSLGFTVTVVKDEGSPMYKIEW